MAARLVVSSGHAHDKIFKNKSLGCRSTKPLIQRRKDTEFHRLHLRTEINSASAKLNEISSALYQTKIAPLGLQIVEPLLQPNCTLGLKISEPLLKKGDPTPVCRA
jgi:hypothetical protein